MSPNIRIGTDTAYAVLGLDGYKEQLYVKDTRTLTNYPAKRIVAEEVIGTTGTKKPHTNASYDNHRSQRSAGEGSTKRLVLVCIDLPLSYSSSWFVITGSRWYTIQSISPGKHVGRHHETDDLITYTITFDISFF